LFLKSVARFMRSSEAEPRWWDAETDPQSGQTLRADVRESAHRVWKSACSEARRLLRDDADAPQLLESAVRTVSRYLDKRAVQLFSSDLDGLVFLAFHRSVTRLARQRRRIESVGGANEIAKLLRAPDWSEGVDSRLMLEQLARSLTALNRTILRLRISGHGWKEIGRIVEMTPAAARQAFWRELRKAYLSMMQPSRTQKEP
jgi:hypothetical protein